MSENNECKKAFCALCNNLCDKDSPVLVMGPYGNPRLLCPECAEELDKVTLGKEVEEIRAAMVRIGEKMAVKNPDDLSLGTVNAIFEDAAERARLIEEGEYDFSLDETDASEEELLDIPEEQRESEEDKLLDEKDEEKMRKLDKILNWAFIAVIAAVVGFFVIKFIIGLF